MEAEGGAAAGGEAQGGSAEREVRYAEPWDAEVDKKNIILVQFLLKVFIVFCAIVILIVGIFIGVYSTDTNLGSWFFGISWTLFLVSSGCLSIKGIVIDSTKDSLENEGWTNNGIAFIKFLRAIGIPGLFFFPLMAIGLHLQDGVNLTEFWMILIIILWLFFEYFGVITQAYQRDIDLPFIDVVSILEMSYKFYIPNAEIKKKRVNCCSFVDGEDKIVIVRKGIDQSIVNVLTPRDQSERNRELREAVSAILEGHPWPPESGDGDAPGGARPEEGA